MTFEAGQSWSYAASPEGVASRIVIGAIVEFPGRRRIACCTVHGALERRPGGTCEFVTIPFLPITFEALERTVTALDGTGEPADDFAGHLSAWSNDPRGASFFTVPFEGSLERLIGLQMAAIVEQP